MPCEAKLAKIAYAANSFRRAFTPNQPRQEQRSQHPNDGDDHKQFDQAECIAGRDAIPVSAMRTYACHIRPMAGWRARDRMPDQAARWCLTKPVRDRFRRSVER